MRRVQERLRGPEDLVRVVLEPRNVLDEPLAVDHRLEPSAEVINLEQLDQEAVGGREEIELLGRGRLVHAELRLLFGARQQRHQLGQVGLADAFVVA